MLKSPKDLKSLFSEVFVFSCFFELPRFFSHRERQSRVDLLKNRYCPWLRCMLHQTTTKMMENEDFRRAYIYHSFVY